MDRFEGMIPFHETGQKARDTFRRLLPAGFAKLQVSCRTVRGLGIGQPFAPGRLLIVRLDLMIACAASHYGSFDNFGGFALPLFILSR